MREGRKTQFLLVGGQKLSVILLSFGFFIAAMVDNIITLGDVFVTTTENVLFTSLLMLVPWSSNFQSFAALILILVHILAAFLNYGVMVGLKTTLNTQMLEMIMVTGFNLASLTDEQKGYAILIALAAILPPLLVAWRIQLRTKFFPNLPTHKPDLVSKHVPQKRKSSFLIICALCIYVLGHKNGYFSPIHSLFTSMIGIVHHSTFTAASKLNFSLKPSDKPKNLFFILNESLGTHFTKDKKGRPLSSPLYKKYVYSEKENQLSPFYDSARAFATSSNTNTATPGVLLGQYIVGLTNSIEHKGFFNIPTLMSLAKSMNYTTAAFVSYETRYLYGWPELTEIFNQFDYVLSKTTLNASSVNDLGMDDRVTLMYLQRYLEKIDPGKPFFILTIFNNAHHPFLVTEDYTPSKNKSSPEESWNRAQFTTNMTDSMTFSILNQLEKINVLENTAVVFSADHGETPRTPGLRIVKSDSRFMGVPLWFRIPHSFLTVKQKLTLRTNLLKRIVSNLDVVPTLMELMGWSSAIPMLSNRTSIKAGQSLLSPIPENRIISGWQGGPFVLSCDWTSAYVSNGTHNLFLRQKNYVFVEKLNPLNPSIVLEKTDWDNLSKEDKMYWNSTVRQNAKEVHQGMKICGFKVF
jgi:hypothetical protein